MLTAATLPNSGGWAGRRDLYGREEGTLAKPEPAGRQATCGLLTCSYSEKLKLSACIEEKE